VGFERASRGLPNKPGSKIVQCGDASIEVDRNSIPAEETVADDPTELEAEERARCLEIEHHHGRAADSNGTEFESARSGARSWKLEAGSWKLEAGS
jgi:hypothetical protein